MLECFVQSIGRAKLFADADLWFDALADDDGNVRQKHDHAQAEGEADPVQHSGEGVLSGTLLVFAIRHGVTLYATR
jgi:hypothetical protein